jgi:hypothetical protein
MPTEDTYVVAPIELGHGTLEVEFFLEATCPYSKRAFEKLPALLAAIGEDKVMVRIRLLSQPWHLFSPVVTRCVLAACATEGGQEAGLKTMAAIYAHREDFVCQNHSEGPNMNRSPADVLKQISELSGIDLSEAFKSKSVGRAMTWHAKYSRQNGVHVSPSFAINGLLEPAMSSGQTIEEWSALLTPHIAA